MLPGQKELFAADLGQAPAADQIPAHPLAALFPLLDGPEFDELARDIAAHGQRDPIIIHEGQILDGRNRYRACQVAGVNPRFEMFNPALDGDPLAYVLSRNLKRRHLNESQRAMVAARLETLSHGGHNKKQDANLRLASMSRAAAAEALRVSPRSVCSAAKVRDEAAAEIQDAVDRGLLAVNAAAAAAALPIEQQREVGLKALAGTADTARNLIKRAARDAREAELARRQEKDNLALPQKKYGVILADPEWRFEPRSRATGMDRAADNHYPTSATAVIAARPVGEIAAADCVLFLWATIPMLPAAFEVMEAWGFAYKSHLVWIKDKVGTGYWFRERHELLLLATRGAPCGPAPGMQSNSVLESPRRAHSQKPPEIYDLIEKYFPHLTKIELNAREARPGWDRWGAEAEAPLDLAAAPAAEPTLAAAMLSAMQGSPADPAPVSAEAVNDGLDIPDFLRRGRVTP